MSDPMPNRTNFATPVAEDEIDLIDAINANFVEEVLSGLFAAATIRADWYP